MSVVQSHRYCSECDEYRLFEKRVLSGLLGFTLTVLTLGLFVIPWTVILLLDATTPPRCQTCGALYSRRRKDDDEKETEPEPPPLPPKWSNLPRPRR